MKKYLLPLLFLLLLINPVLAVTVRCGTPQGHGDYLFTNTDPVTVRVFINTGGTSISASPNNFNLPPGGSQLVQLRAPTDTYARLFVTYIDTVNNFSASLECYFYATTGSSGSTTTTTIQQGSCSSYTDATSCRNAGCVWMSIGLGYCTESTGSTTTQPSQTTTTVVTTTTQPSQTTTTQSSQCAGRSFTSCSLISSCEWVGSYATGYCRDKVSSTTTTTLAVETTTTIASTPSSNSGTSGGSTGGGTSYSSSGGSASGASKSTGFYDFPSFIQIPANGEKTIKGTFYAARDLTDVKFQVADIDANWFTITPSSVQAIKSGETINLTVSIKVPENAKQDSYVFRLLAKTNVNYEKKMTLAVTEKVVTTTTTTVLVTTTTVQKQASTGFFAKTARLALDYWYLIAVPTAIIITLAALPLTGKKSKGSAYMVVEDEQDYRQEFVEIKLKEPEQPKPVEKPVEKAKRDIDERIRKKVIQEIRERALKSKR